MGYLEIPVIWSFGKKLKSYGIVIFDYIYIIELNK